MKSFIQALIAAFALPMIVMAAPVGICLHAYSPEAPAEKIECFEFEKIEKAQSGKRFFLSNGTSVIVTDYRNRGIIMYPARQAAAPETLATLLATYEAQAKQSPATRKFLNPWILKLRNNQAEVAKQVEKIAAMPSVTLPDGTVLEGCKATRIIDDVVYMTHSYGTKKIKLSNLSEASQKALKLDEIQKIVTPASAAPPAEMAKFPTNGPESKSTPATTQSHPKKTGIGDFPLLGESVDSIRIVAEKGDADAQYRLGICYEHAKGVAQNLNEAVKWYRKAADQESPVGQYLVGHCYDEGKGVPQDFHEAVKWYRLAADNGNAIAQLNLGNCYFKGEGVTKDLGMAAAFWQKAAQQGIPMAQLNIGNCYAAGNGVMSDKTLAYMWCDLAAAAGVPAGAEDRDTIAKKMTKQEVEEAKSMASKWHPKPHGTLRGFESSSPKDGQSSIDIIRASAERGDAQAQSALGRCYDDGLGVPEDSAIAVEWYRKAAEQGNANGQRYLGLHYALGIALPKDLPESFKWITKSAEQGSAEAQSYLGICYIKGFDIQKNISEGIKWLTKAADQGDSDAQCLLGKCYDGGNGVRKDGKQAAKLFELAANQGHTESQWRLGLDHVVGINVPQDDLTAYMWFELSAKAGNEDGIKARNAFAPQLTRDQIAGAKQMAKEWRATKKTEPKAEHFDGGFTLPSESAQVPNSTNSKPPTAQQVQQNPSDDRNPALTEHVMRQSGMTREQVLEERRKIQYMLEHPEGLAPIK